MKPRELLTLERRLRDRSWDAAQLQPKESSRSASDLEAIESLPSPPGFVQSSAISDNDGGQEPRNVLTHGPRVAGPVGMPAEDERQRSSPHDGDGGDGGGYDRDGLRVVWDSGPKPEVRAARSAWKALALSECVSWSQTSDEVNAWIKIPKGGGYTDVITHQLFDAAWRSLNQPGGSLQNDSHYQGMLPSADFSASMQAPGARR